MILCITAQVITVLNGVIHCLLGYLLSFRELPAKVNKARVTMSSATSDVTYTSVYTDSEPGRAFWGADDEEVSEGGIPRVIVLGYDGLPLQPVAPPSPDYIPGPEDPQILPVPQDEDEREPMFIQAHDPDYVPEPIYPEYIPLEDDHEFPAEEQPLPPIDSPTTESPGYVTESDPEEDWRTDDAHDEDGDDEDEDDEDEEEDGALARLLYYNHYLLIEVERLSDHDYPSPSPPISLSPPSAAGALARCRAPPPAHSHFYHNHLCLTQNPDTQDSIHTWISLMQFTAHYHTNHLSSLPSPLLTIGMIFPIDDEERRQGIRDVGYGIRDTWVDPAEAVPEIAPMTVEEIQLGTETRFQMQHADVSSTLERTRGSPGEASGTRSEHLVIYVIESLLEIWDTYQPEEDKYHVNDTNRKQHDPRIVQAMDDQALLRDSPIGDEATCQPLNFKGLKAVGRFNSMDEKMDECRKESTNMDRRERSRNGGSCPVKTSAISTTLASCTHEVPQVQQDRALCSRFAGVSVTQMTHSKKIVQNRRIKMEEMGIHKDGFNAVGNARVEGKYAHGNLDANVVHCFDVIIGMELVFKKISAVDRIAMEKLVQERGGHVGKETDKRNVPMYGIFQRGFPRLPERNKVFDSGRKGENAFQLIKQKLCSAPILALPEGREDFVVYCDASHKGLGNSKRFVPRCVSRKETLSHCPGSSLCYGLIRFGSSQMNIRARIRSLKPREYVNEDVGGKIEGIYPKERLADIATYVSKSPDMCKSQTNIKGHFRIAEYKPEIPSGSIKGLPMRHCMVAKNVPGITSMLGRGSTRATLIGKRKPMEFENWETELCSGLTLKGVVVRLEGIHVDDKLQFVARAIESWIGRSNDLKRSRIRWLRFAEL
ncbi:putative reverse transcriptase domain-containing protein [Tanacetum coccineum]